jgi:threonine dehydrogenase-like Zn-dependent dehydrogenase
MEPIPELRRREVETYLEVVAERGADLVIELAGTESAGRQAVKLARRGGSVVLAGATSAGRRLDVDLREIVVGHKDIFGSVANPAWICERGLRLVARGLIEVEPLLTHRFPLEEFEAALSAFETRKDGAYRVMLYPGRSEAQLDSSTGLDH